MDLTENLSAEEQAQFDAMRAADQPEASPTDATAAPVPALPAEGAPEAVKSEGVTPQGDAEKREDRSVPLKTFLEERRKLEDRLAQEQRRSQTLEERTNLLLGKIGQPQHPAQPAAPEAPKIPDLATDPAGHILETMRVTGMNLEQLTQAVREQSERQRQQDMIGDLQRRSAVAEQEFRAETPDYDAAVNHLIGVRNKQLEITGMTDPAQRYAVIDREKLQLAAAAAQQGKNPAAIAYELAKSYGYAPAAPAAAVPAAAQPEANAGAEKLERIEAGQQQGRSLGAARGNAPSATPPAQRLLEMPQDKFAEMLDKATPEQMREMFGG